MSTGGLAEESASLLSAGTDEVTVVSGSLLGIFLPPCLCIVDCT